MTQASVRLPGSFEDRRRAAPRGSPLRVLGVDTSLRSTGYGVVEAVGARLASIEFGILKTSPKMLLSECLVHISGELDDIIKRLAPAAAAVEGIFFSKNVQTTLLLGHARGVAIAACAAHRLPIYEYAPRRVKQSIVGFGGAGKEQIQAMIATLLGLPEKPREDEADALALAICHLHSQSALAALDAKRI